MPTLKTALPISTVLLSLLGAGSFIFNVSANASTAFTIKSAPPKQILSVALSAEG